jgi:cell division protein ZapA
MKQPVSVTILGERYTVRAEEDAAYVQKVAEYVESKLAEVVKGASGLPSSKAIVLASLNIADELFKRETDRERSETALAERLARLSDLLRAELGREAEVPPSGQRS